LSEAHPDEKETFVGGHVVLDLLNTVAMVAGRLVDNLEDDKAVFQWLTRAAQLAPVMTRKAFPPGALVRAARELREAVRDAIVQRKFGKRVDVHALNALLAKGMSHVSLVSRKDGTLSLGREWKVETPEQLLIPLAEAAADLLANGNFDLIRKCESDTCVLWFYDRTKSHHRRWCSVSTCGNRSKVAAFRRRRSEATKI
jgi:predicted RNA-binding Zn ribbon-like protein